MCGPWAVVVIGLAFCLSTTLVSGFVSQRITAVTRLREPPIALSTWTTRVSATLKLQSQTSALSNRLLSSALRSSRSAFTQVEEDEDEDDEYAEMSPQEQEEYLRSEFRSLTRGSGKLSLRDFLRWDEIKSVISDGLLSREEVCLVWSQICGGETSFADEMKFVTVNAELSNLLNQNQHANEDEDEDEDEDYDSEDNDDSHSELVLPPGMRSKSKVSLSSTASMPTSSSAKPNPTAPVTQASMISAASLAEEDESLVDSDEDYVDIFDRNVDPKDYLEDDYFLYLKEVFEKATSETSTGLLKSTAELNSQPRDGNFGRLSFTQFMQWDEMKEFANSSHIGPKNFEALWTAAVAFDNGRDSSVIQIPNSMSDMETMMSNTPPAAIAKALTESIGFDTFLRLRIRLEVMHEEIEFALDQLEQSGAQEYYREQFLKLTKGEGQLDWNSFREWSEVVDLLQRSLISEEDLQLLWKYQTNRSIGERALAQAIAASPNAVSGNSIPLPVCAPDLDPLPQDSADDSLNKTLSADEFVELNANIEEFLQTQISSNE